MLKLTMKPVSITKRFALFIQLFLV